MDRNSKVAWIVLFLVLIAVLVGCSDKRHKDRFQWDEIIATNIKQKATTGEATFLDVRRVMPFGWEAFYVFPPHTPLEHIERTLGFKWKKAKDTRINEREDIALLVFVIGQTVHEYIEQPRSQGDFSMLKAAYPYTPDEAYFEVVAKSEEGEKRLVFEEAQRPR